MTEQDLLINETDEELQPGIDEDPEIILKKANNLHNRFQKYLEHLPENVTNKITRRDSKNNPWFISWKNANESGLIAKLLIEPGFFPSRDTLFSLSFDDRNDSTPEFRTFSIRPGYGFLDQINTTWSVQMTENIFNDLICPFENEYDPRPLIDDYPSGKTPFRIGED